LPELPRVGAREPAVPPDDLEAFARAAGPIVLANATDAAAVQIEAYHRQVTTWRKSLGADAWKRVRVVVLGKQLPRKENIATQYFARLLDVPGEGPRLSYAEELSGDDAAIDLLGSRLLDRTAARAFFNDPERLERDLLSDGAKVYLEWRTWGTEHRGDEREGVPRLPAPWLEWRLVSSRTATPPPRIIETSHHDHSASRYCPHPGCLEHDWLPHPAAIADDTASRVTTVAVSSLGRPVVAKTDAEGAIHLLCDSQEGPKYAKSNDGGVTFGPAIPVVSGGSQASGLEYSAWDMAVGKGGRVHCGNGHERLEAQAAAGRVGVLLRAPRPRSEGVLAGAKHQPEAERRVLAGR